jgi:hypothetical protein
MSSYRYTDDEKVDGPSEHYGSSNQAPVFYDGKPHLPCSNSIANTNQPEQTKMSLARKTVIKFATRPSPGRWWPY